MKTFHVVVDFRVEAVSKIEAETREEAIAILAADARACTPKMNRDNVDSLFMYVNCIECSAVELPSD